MTRNSSDKKFWKTQPVAIGEENVGIIEIPEKKSEYSAKQTRTPLPEGLEFRNVSDIEMLVEFLKFNYVSDPSEDFSLLYSREMFEKLFKTSCEEYSLGVFTENSIIGYIFAKEHTLVIEGVSEIVISINFLCLRKTHRNKFLAPLLIAEMKRIAYAKGIYKAIFTNASNKGFAFSEATYYHLPLNLNKLKSLIYIPLDFKEKTFKMRPGTFVPKGSDFDQIFERYQNDCKNYKVFEKFSRTDFEINFKEVENTFYSLYNDSTKEFASFYIIETFCWNEMTSIKKGYMYYWFGTESIIEDALEFAKILKVDMFDVLNLGKNEIEIVENFGFLEGSGSIFYHLFNWKVPLQARSRVNFILY